MSTNPESGRSTESPNGFNIAFQPNKQTVQKLVKPLFTEEGLRYRRDRDEGLLRLHLPGKFDLLEPVADTDRDLAMTAILADAAADLGRNKNRPLYIEAAFGIPRNVKVHNPKERMYETVNMGLEYGFTFDAEDEDFVDHITRAALRRRSSPYVSNSSNRGDMPLGAISMGIPRAHLGYRAADQIPTFVTSKVNEANKALDEDKKKKIEERKYFIPISGIKIVEIP